MDIFDKNGEEKLQDNSFRQRKMEGSCKGGAGE